MIKHLIGLRAYNQKVKYYSLKEQKVKILFLKCHKFVCVQSNT